MSKDIYEKVFKELIEHFGIKTKKLGMSIQAEDPEEVFAFIRTNLIPKEAVIELLEGKKGCGCDSEDCFESEQTLSQVIKEIKNL